MPPVGSVTVTPTASPCPLTGAAAEVSPLAVNIAALKETAREQVAGVTGKEAAAAGPETVTIKYKADPNKPKQERIVGFVRLTPPFTYQDVREAISTTIKDHGMVSSRLHCFHQ